MILSSYKNVVYFRPLTNGKDRQNVNDFLKVNKLDGHFPTNGLLTNPEQTRNNQPNKIILLRTNSRDVGFQYRLSDEQETPCENHQQQISNYSPMESSHHSFNSFSYPKTVNNFNQTITTSNKKSFDDQMIPLFRSDATTIYSTFCNIEQFDHNKSRLLQYIDSNIIGKNIRINTPWGSRKMIYADYTASGRGLTFIEHYMLNNVLPHYANTHSDNNACGRQTTKFREEARTMIKRYVNGTNDDVVIFTGSGSTAAINKLVHVLQLNDEEVRSKTVVFISAFEHHSNILPWIESGVKVIRIPNDKQGLIDEDFLENRLKYYHNNIKKQIICTFNAASNVTGIQTDVDRISRLVHLYNGWIFWDYAAAAPYVKIDMNPSKLTYKDAIFISPHKFVGGPSTPGILIAKKTFFTDRVPSDVGGGTVNFVTRTRIEYVTDIERREEGGTPNILGAIRAGLVFHLKESVGYHVIEAREHVLVKKVFARFRNHRTLIILGSTTIPRLAIFSFRIYVPSLDKYIHHNFICVLLNDLFGIQVRSGCSCAGPYVLDLLGIDDKTIDIYTKFITQEDNDRLHGIPKIELMKPGFARFNLSYFANDEEIDYILNAIEFIANDGWKFLSLYTYDVKTAVWRLRTMPSENNFSHFHSLQMVTYQNDTMEENILQQQMEFHNSNSSHLMIDSSSSDDPIEQAKSMANNISKYVYENVDLRMEPPINIPDEYKDLIWFVTSRDIIQKIIIDYEQNLKTYSKPVPFRSKMYH
ncbi:unnamed protein product [Rotaria sordida]|uniref:Aminotransferase class V domain-containing protein n=1 Tax=Rotaria sordida TaxID=392033 RepID=A0A814T632_9BILA|nr:unnamed protein product [Rotaria sordida]